MRGILAVVLYLLCFSVAEAAPREFIVGFLEAKEADQELIFRMRSGGARQIERYKNTSSLIPCVKFTNQYGHDDAYCSLRFNADGLAPSKIDESFIQEEGFTDIGWGSVGIDDEEMVVRIRTTAAKKLRAFIKKDSENVECKIVAGGGGYKIAAGLPSPFCKMRFLEGEIVERKSVN